jgi:hypothetical protein
MKGVEQTTSEFAKSIPQHASRRVRLSQYHPWAVLWAADIVAIASGSQGRTKQRAYGSNRNTTIVSDLPSEAKLQPREWGVWKIE